LLLIKRTTLALTVILTLLISGLTVLVPSSSAISETSQLEWRKTYSYISGVSILQTEDDNLVIAAETGTDWFYNFHANYDYTDRAGALIKINLNGSTIWRKQLPLEPVTLIKTKNDGFAVAGSVRRLLYTDSYLGRVYGHFISLARTDSQGNILWDQTYEKLKTDVPDNVTSNSISVTSAIQSSDGGFVLGGTQSTYVGYQGYHVYYKAWLMKTDSMGNMLWINYYGEKERPVMEHYGDPRNSVQKIVETPDNGFLFAGYLDGANIIKTDSQGNVQWTKTYDDIRFRSMLKTEEGAFVFAGYQGAYESAFVVKLDSAFNALWNKTFDEYSACSIKEGVDDGYLFTNYVNSGNSLFKTDLEGNVEWIYKSNGSISSAIQTKDGKYALTGSINDPEAAGKTMSEGDITDIMVEMFALKPSVSPSPTLSPEPTESGQSTIILVVALIVTVSVVGLSLLVYFKKRKH
jgi:hypothetical protein